MLFRRRLWLATIIIAAFIFFYRLDFGLRDVKSRVTRQKHRPHLRITKPRYPLSQVVPLPTGQAKSLPSVQADFKTIKESPDTRKQRLERQRAVKEAFLHSWEGYKFHAFAKDEVRPISGGSRDSFGGWGATMVDTMDFLWLLGMKGDFDMCVDAVGKIDFTTNTEDSLNVFETTIRYLGGLLSAYDISGQKYHKLLDKAKELGDILYLAFDTANHMPVTRWDWKKSAQGLPLEQSPDLLLAELASLSLEFTRLSQLTKDPKYYDAINRISEHLFSVQNTTRVPGLWPTVVDAQTLDFSHNHFTLGGMVDSAYEYLPKQFLLLGGLVPMYQDMYVHAIQTVKKHLFFRPLIPTNEDVLFSGNAGIHSNHKLVTETQAQHLGCFTGGMVAMSSKIFDLPADMQIARRLVNGCIWAYNAMPSGLMPEVFHVSPCYIGTEPDSERPAADTKCVWDDDKWYANVADHHGPSDDTVGMDAIQAGKFWVKERALQKGFIEHPDNRYLLRPEAIESIFILYRTTGDPLLLDKAWEMFQSIEKITRTQIAYAGIHDVRAPPEKVMKSDRMESFWMAETLKYFWLIFADPNTVSLDEWVLNTEAHMFMRPRAGQSVA